MKNKLYILIVGFFCLFTACNDDFMERYPLDKITDDIFWESEEHFKLYLNGLYPLYIIGHQDGWAQDRTYPTNIMGSPLMYGDIFSDNAVKSGSEDPRLAGTHPTPTGSANTGWDWKNMRRINYFLTHYQKAEMDEETKLKYASEAWFFKAWDYYKKVLYFGDVPWLSKDLKSDSEELYDPRDSRTVVMDSVLWCLNQAVKYLPEKGKEQAGRLNKDQANFLKARICLHEGTFRKYHTELGLQDSANKFLQEAVTACEALLGKYTLYTNGDNPYWKMFATTDVADNNEVILARTYIENEVGHAAQRYYDQNNSNRQAMGATRGLVDEYLCIDGQPIYTGGTEGSYVQNPNFKGYGKWTELENRDPRLTQTICKPGEYVSIYAGGVMSLENNGITYPALAYNGGTAVASGYRVIKHWMGDMIEQDRVTNGIQVGIEFRYAEVLLNYAEAKYELTGTLSQEDVNLTINALRERAGFDFTKYPTAKLNVNKIPADPRLDKIYADKLEYPVSPLLREIRRERRVELAMENHRYEDLMRWKAGPLFTVPLRGIHFKSVEQLYDGDHKTKPEIAAGVTVGKDIRIDEDGFIICYPFSPYVNTIDGVLPWDDYRYYFPIPKEEIIMNPKLTQNPGWENR